MKYNTDAFMHDNPGDPICIGCGKKAADLQEYRMAAFDEEEDYNRASEEELKKAAINYVKHEEGTFNHHNGHFLCTSCYMRADMPSSPRGWRAP